MVKRNFKSCTRSRAFFLLLFLRSRRFSLKAAARSSSAASLACVSATLVSMLDSCFSAHVRSAMGLPGTFDMHSRTLLSMEAKQTTTSLRQVGIA